MGLKLNQVSIDGVAPPRPRARETTCSIQRQITGVVAGHGRFLLVGPVVLLIENNETKRIERHENGRARPHHQQRLFRMKTALPHSESLAIAAAAVVFEDPCPKAATTTINKLGNETDFRRQDQHMATSRQLLGCQLEVDLRLPGTRDSPKQQP